ncbi:hypothetical protein V1260_13410 [Brachybacterium sp. J144]|uniref:hypothetical protein n=1 Tax=Brachybacterium sp. J144 TaxID=3116487 RepID=UPI002E78954B|nr:hypothetical protein [Brachybacterium sp. J144]MEE1651780.1 hypothetical protein [Brachybacterium sp. J144]
MSTAPSWTALCERLAVRYAAAGTAPALAARRCRALAAVADQLPHLSPERAGPGELLAALDALGLDLYHWHLYRLALADALPAGGELPTHRPPRPTTARHP